MILMIFYLLLHNLRFFLEVKADFGYECSHEKVLRENCGKAGLYDCFCNGVRTQTYCPGQTIILYNYNKLYIIGLKEPDIDETPFFNLYIEPNPPIVSVNYDFLNANLSWIRNGGTHVRVKHHRDLYPEEFTYTWYFDTVINYQFDEHGGNNFFQLEQENKIGLMACDTEYDYSVNWRYFLSGNSTFQMITFNVFAVDGFMFILWGKKGTFLLEVIATDGNPGSRYTLYENSTLNVNAVNCSLKQAAFMKRKDNAVEFYMWFFHRGMQLLQEFTILRYIDANTWSTNIDTYQICDAAGQKVTDVASYTPLYRKTKKRLFWLTTKALAILKCGYADPSTKIITESKTFSYTINGLDQTQEIHLYGVNKFSSDMIRKTECAYRRGNCAHICLVSADLQNNTCACTLDKKIPFKHNSTICKLARGYIAPSKKKIERMLCNLRACSQEESRKQFFTEVTVYLIIIFVLFCILIFKTII